MFYIYIYPPTYLNFLDVYIDRIHRIRLWIVVVMRMSIYLRQPDCSPEPEQFHAQPSP